MNLLLKIELAVVCHFNVVLSFITRKIATRDQKKKFTCNEPQEI